MSGKNILQLIGDLEPGGAEKTVANLAKGLKDFDFKVSICCREGGSLIQSLNGVPVRILPKKNTLDPNYLLKLCQYIRENNIDLVHSHLFGNNFYGFCAAAITRRKAILTIHGEDCFDSKKRRCFYRLAATLMSRIVTVSKPLHDRLIDDVGINKKKVFLIPNGIDTSHYHSRIDVRDQKIKLQLPAKACVIGVIGNIKPVKGYDILLNAAVDIIKEVPEACFVIVGGIYQYEEHYKKLKELTVEKHIQDRVYFLGKKDNVKDILSIFDVYVLPSRSEGTSIALLEAMASGRPIVATMVGGTPDVIEDGVNGILVPPENPFLLTMAILRVLKNKPLAADLGKRAQQQVEKDFSINTMVKKYLALYDEVLKC